MMYSSSKEAIKRSLNGLAIDIQANDADDIEQSEIVKRASSTTSRPRAKCRCRASVRLAATARRGRDPWIKVIVAAR